MEYSRQSHQMLRRYADDAAQQDTRPRRSGQQRVEADDRRREKRRSGELMMRSWRVPDE